jgi:hypothetical protein
MTATNVNLIQEKNKRTLNSGNACYLLVWYILSSRLLSKDVKIRIFRTIVLSVVLYGRETCSLTLREQHSLRLFENRVQRRTFGPNKDEMTGAWRKLHNEELYNMYLSPSIIRMMTSRRMRWTEHKAVMMAKRNAYRILVGKSEGKRSLGRRRRWLLL